MTSTLMPLTASRTTRLVGDIGGTHLRLALVGKSQHQPRATSVLRCGDYPDMQSAVSHYLAPLSAHCRPSSACIAAAGPINGDRVALTNNDFSFSIEQARRALGLEQLLVVNDLAALARSVPNLGADEAVSLIGGNLKPDRTIAVVAPGTGLGVAALVPTPRGPVVISGEGGHAPLPASDASAAVAGALLKLQGHVSGEDVLSATGLPVLDVVLRALQGERAPRPRAALDISTSREEGPGQVLHLFVELLALVVQSHVLTFGAQGGVVLGGGFLPGLVDVLQRSGFQERFTTHPKMRSYLEDIPVVVDLRTHPTLLGATLFLEDRA